MGWVEGFEPSATGTTNQNIGSSRAKDFALSIRYASFGLSQDNVHLPPNHYKTTTVQALYFVTHNRVQVPHRRKVEMQPAGHLA